MKRLSYKSVASVQQGDGKVLSITTVNTISTVFDLIALHELGWITEWHRIENDEILVQMELKHLIGQDTSALIIGELTKKD